MFYVRDETLGKDRSRSRPQVMATRRNTALSLLRITGSTIISTNSRDCSWKAQLAKNLLAIVSLDGAAGQPSKKLD